MALNLITPSFGPVVFAKNPVIIKLRSLDGSSLPYAAQGATAKVAAGSSKIPAGGTLTVNYDEPDGTSESVVFTAAATYTGEAEIPDDTYSGSIANYWEAVRAKVAKHHRIAPYFTVTRTGPLGGNSLIIKAISSDAGWVVTFATTESFTLTDTAPTTDTTPINYSVLVEVFFERTYKGGDYALRAQLKNTPDADGYMTFDLSSILEAECAAGLVAPVVPVWDTADTSEGANLRKWYVRYTEQYGTPIVAQEWQYDELRVCMNGGVSQSFYAASDFLSGLNTDDALLTWFADGKKVGLSQPEYLLWYNWDVETRYVKIEMKWYSIVDNAASTPTQHFSEVLTETKRTALLPVGATLLGLDMEPDAYKYQVRVVYQDGASYVGVSQWRTYYIERDYFNSERYLMYLNGFGAPECCRCTGTWGKKIDIQRTLAEKPLLPDYNEFATERFQFSQDFEQELTYRTGYIRRADAEVLQEMLIAGDVYDVGPDGYIPLIISTNSFQVTDTDEDLHAYQFTARPRLGMRNFSKRTVSSLITGAWQEPSGDAWFDAFLIPWELP